MAYSDIEALSRFDITVSREKEVSMLIEFKKTGMFGKVKSVTTVNDDSIIVDDEVCPISNILSFSKTKNFPEICFFGAFGEIGDDDIVAILRKISEVRLDSLPWDDHDDWWNFGKAYRSVMLHEESDDLTAPKGKAFKHVINYGDRASDGEAILEHLEANSMRSKWLELRQQVMNDSGDAPQFDSVESLMDSVPREIRKRCNVCGTVFCYNAEDIKKNMGNAVSNIAGGVMQIGAAFSGNVGAGIYGRQIKEEIVDYSRCPNCRSTDISDYDSKQDAAIAQPIAESAQASNSDADEILKFKNLLDLGILTQEEFDAKKSQLLGL